MSYGKGKTLQIVTQEGDKFTVVNRAMKETTVSFVVGGGQQETLDAEGKMNQVTPTWDGEVLSMSIVRDDGKLMTQKRYMNGDDMVLDAECNGQHLIRIFVKQATA